MKFCLIGLCDRLELEAFKTVLPSVVPVEDVIAEVRETAVDAIIVRIVGEAVKADPSASASWITGHLVIVPVHLVQQIDKFLILEHDSPDSHFHAAEYIVTNFGRQVFFADLEVLCRPNAPY